MRKYYQKNKAGVSLITVLMFMLVATIAATATWKFITSEGFSSTSRMLKREAYQSAQAGIENTRSWMTFHANDVGALVKQYLSKENHTCKKNGFESGSTYACNINIDNQLRSNALQRAGQNYHVWLTGVNAEKSTYKLKILSSGEARNNTRHTELAIFNVDGLYKVQLPQTKSSSNFAEAFHGQMQSIDVLDVDRAVITQTMEVKNSGGQAANDINVTDYLIMDGSFYANDKNKINKLYVTGDVGTCSGINIDSNVYMGGVFYPGNVKSTIGGSLYTEGGINLRDFYPYTALTGGCANKTPGSAEIKGNITSNGPFIYYDNGGSHSFVGQKSMVSNSYIQFPTTHYQGVTWISGDRVQIKHNVYVKEDNPGYMGEAYRPDNPDGYRDAVPRTLFGSGDDDKIWLKGFYHFQNGSTKTDLNYANESYTNNVQCEYNGYTCARSGGFKKWIGYKGTFLDAEPSSEDMSSWNADRMSKYAEKLEEKDENCNTAKTPIQINTKIFDRGLTHSKSHMMGCNANIWSDWENNVWLMNECYKTAKARDELYNNDWLILEVNSGEGWQKDKMKGELQGNFIIKINATGSAWSAQQKYLPATGGDSKVMLYLPNGWPGDNQPIEFAETTNKRHRYFVFSEGDIKRFDMIGLDPPMSGSVVMGKCSKFNTGGNNTIKVYFDQAMTDDLTEANIICDNDGSNECSNSTSGSGSGSSGGTSDTNSYDRYYISMAPQLGISLESQSKSYENMDKYPNANTSNPLTSSFIILPRVISLPNDPYGRLEDYFNVLTLNAPANVQPLKKSQLSLDGSCTAANGITTLDISDLSSKIYDPQLGNKLRKGTYKCNIKAPSTFSNATVPLWIVVDNKGERGLHKISFAEPSQDIGANDVKDISVRLQPQISPIEITVSCPTPPNSWEYVPSTVVSGGKCKFTVSNSNYTEKVVKLFSIKTTAASSGSMNFQLEQSENNSDYIVTEPSITSLYMSTVKSLYRSPVNNIEQIQSYCSTDIENCPTADDYIYWPDCALNADEVWVEPDGAGYQTEYANDSWLITSTTSSSVKLRNVHSGNCVIIIPENETCSFTDDTPYCTLHASAKAKAKRVKFKFKNVESNKDPFIIITSGTRTKYCTYSESSEHECTMNVYDGDSISMKINTDYSQNEDFRYWKCKGSSCPDTTKLNSNTYPPFIVSDNETVVTVMFSEIDKHCFFDKFQNSAAACENLRSDESKEYCIDYCNPADNCESAEKSGGYPNSKWRLIQGKTSMIDYGNGKISVLKNGDITMMSTINADAGTYGTLKALVRLPKDNSSKSGFLLGSFPDASDYLMLTVFIDNSGYLKARVCNKTSDKCKEESLTISATENDMIMIEAEITATEISVLASKDNESSKVNVRFSLDFWGGSYQGTHVGFRIASPKFKLYGIGWKSKNYECFNTFPTIKCSFAAVAQNGVIPKQQYVKPWVGYSGWKGWNENDCTEKYYYKGSDACSGNAYSYTTCSNDGYYFNASSNGKHGYTDNSGNEIKTAKVGLQCNNSSYNSEDMMWANDSAHCGVFWTGSLNACTSIESINDEVTIYGSGQQSVAFSKAVNLRDARISIETENPDNSEIQVRLYSQQGDALYPSEYATMTRASQIFNIDEFSTETSGFDPGKVKSVYFENKGNSPVTIKRVASICETAVKVDSCKVEEKTIGWWWAQQKRILITASINNIDGVQDFMATAQKKQNEKTLTNEKNRSEIPALDMQVSGSKAYFTFVKAPGADNIDGGISEWTFNVSVRAEDAEYTDPVKCRKVGESPLCRIEKPEPEGPGPAGNKELSQNEVTFKAKMSNCNCSSIEYIITLDNSEINSDKIQCKQAATEGPAAKECDISIPVANIPDLSSGEHTFVLSSKDDEFTACDRSFKIKSTDPTPSIKVTCPADITGQDPGSLIPVNGASVENCANCYFYIYEGSTEKSSGSDITGLAFSDASANDNSSKSYTLKAIDNNSGESGSCTFNVAFKVPSSSSKASSSSVASSSSIASSSSVASSSSAKSSSSVSSSSVASSSSTPKSNSSTTVCKCIAWVNGTGDYNQHCYSSGLSNMNGKCYTMNTDRGTPPQWINGDASQSWWWTEVSCTDWTGCNGSSGNSGSGTSDDPYTNGSITSNEHKYGYSANEWYSVTMSNGGSFVIQNLTNSDDTFTYIDCNGTQHTKTLKAGQNGDCGDGWWNCIENVSGGCTMKFKFNTGGQFDLRVW